jgi:2,4-dienoyl-CoA reductase-like NADH-dependent reductase (Old Yellow Enzyme family)
VKSTEKREVLCRHVTVDSLRLADRSAMGPVTSGAAEADGRAGDRTFAFFRFARSVG